MENDNDNLQGSAESEKIIKQMQDKSDDVVALLSGFLLGHAIHILEIAKGKLTNIAIVPHPPIDVDSLNQLDVPEAEKQKVKEKLNERKGEFCILNNPEDYFNEGETIIFPSDKYVEGWGYQDYLSNGFGKIKDSIAYKERINKENNHQES